MSDNITKSLVVEIKTLTPLWTGGSDRQSKSIKLSGILGSLRWWFEALVRGMGYRACDSTNSQCQIDIRNPADVLNIHRKICPVCYLFGTTGWKSRFLIEVEEDHLKPLYNGKVVVKLNDSRGWHYVAGLWGSAKIRFLYKEQVIGQTNGKNKKIIKIKLSEVFPSILKILLYLIGEHGMLGARTSMGYGVVEFKIDEGNGGKDISITEEDWEKFKMYLSLFCESKKDDRNLPNLKDMFFVKFKVNETIDNLISRMKEKNYYIFKDGMSEADVDKCKNNNWCITAPVVRNCLRCIFRGKHSDRSCGLNQGCERNYWWNKDRNQTNRNYDPSKTIDSLKLHNSHEVQNIRHFLMGSTAEPEFSSIQVSHVYKNQNDELEFRIYGWLPDMNPIQGRINDIIELLTSLFNDAPWKVYIPSQVQNGICWDGSDLSLINNNVEKLIKS